jgi:predicted Zn-dependent peptidase
VVENLYKEVIFDNNLTVVYERLTHLRSVSFGVWIGAGSRNEILDQNGISHFIEHMVFKGTKKRSAKDIACEIDEIGGQINAFTGKDCTCFYTKTLDSDLDKAVDVLSDMLFNSIFDPDHIKTEKKVVLEEISMYEDDPEELVHDLLTGEIWSEGPLGYPILGTQTTLENITRDSILEYMSYFYTPDNCVISVVGNFDESNLMDIVKKYFSSWKPLNYCRLSSEKPSFRKNVFYKEKDIEQTHLCFGFNGLPMSDSRIYPLMVLNNIIGGGLSSRLFQSIREEAGLVYSIYSFPTSFRDCGMFTIYAATNPDKTEQVIECVDEQIRHLLNAGINDAEIIRCKNQLKGNYILGLDSTSSRMSSIGKSKIITGTVYSPEETLKQIDEINITDLMEIAALIFSLENRAITILGSTKTEPSVINKIKL